MEQEKQNLLEMIDRPAFIVRDGIVTMSNQMAQNRLIQPGTAIETYLLTDREAYQNYTGGVLYLNLQFGHLQCGAMVTAQEDGDIFLLDRDIDESQLQALALAAQKLRMPLSNAMAATDCLAPGLEFDQQKELAGQLYKALFQLLRLTGNMADAERCACMDMARFKKTELCHYFRQVTEKAAATLAESDVQIHYTCPETRVFTVIDRERMERALWNLLSNAVKFSDPGASVQVRLSCSGKMAILTVEDQGNGMAPHIQKSLFHRYMREPAVEDSRFGLGLGMILVRSVASLHGGTVLLEQAQGTRVSITMAIRKNAAGNLRSPQLPISDYAGGRDLGLLEFSEMLPAAAYEQNI